MLSCNQNYILNKSEVSLKIEYMNMPGRQYLEHTTSCGCNGYGYICKSSPSRPRKADMRCCFARSIRCCYGFHNRRIDNEHLDTPDKDWEWLLQFLFYKISN